MSLQKTHAHRRLVDDVLPEVKQRRHAEIAAVSREICGELNSTDIGSTQLVLIESVSRVEPLRLVGVVLPRSQASLNVGE